MAAEVADDTHFPESTRNCFFSYYHPHREVEGRIQVIRNIVSHISRVLKGCDPRGSPPSSEGGEWSVSSGCPTVFDMDSVRE